MTTIVRTGGGVPVSDYEALLTEYVTYKSNHSHTNDEYNSYGASQYAAGQAELKENYFSSPTKITTLWHRTGDYYYTLTAPSDGTYVLMVGFSGYAGNGYINLGTGVTEIIRHSWSSQYGGHGGIKDKKKMKAGQTAKVKAGCSGENADNPGVCYEIWRLSD